MGGAAEVLVLGHSFLGNVFQRLQGSGMSLLRPHCASVSEVLLMGLWHWSCKEAARQGCWWHSFPEVGPLRFPFHGVG